jgi:hypothetical protein
MFSILDLRPFTNKKLWKVGKPRILILLLPSIIVVLPPLKVINSLVNDLNFLNRPLSHDICPEKPVSKSTTHYYSLFSMLYVLIDILPFS